MTDNGQTTQFCGVVAPAAMRGARIEVSGPRDSRNVTYSWGILTDDLSKDDTKAAIRRAMQSWEQVGAGITFTEAKAGTTANFTIEWVDFDKDSCLANVMKDELAIAHAFPFGSEAANRMHFKIGQSWGDGPWSRIWKDVQTVAVHELGHVLGLKHSDDDNAVMAPTMWVATSKRDLMEDDRNGLFSLYPSWRPLGGESQGTPAVVSSEPSRTDVFVRGLRNSRVYYKWRVGMEWSPSVDSYEDLGGTVTSNISAVSWVWHKSCEAGAGWSGWTSLGGEIEGDISAVSWAPNRLDLFVKGVAGFVHHKTWDGNAWKPSQTGWNKIGGQSIGWGSPKAVCWGPNRIDVFFRGALAMGSNGVSHSDVYQKTWDGASWQPTDGTWTRLGGSPIGEISVVSKAPNRLDLFIRGSDNNLLSKSWNGSKWAPEGTEWQKLETGGTIKSSPSAVAWPGANLITVVALLSDAKVGMNDYSANTLYPWTGWKPISPLLYPGEKVNSSLVDNPVLVRTGTSRGASQWSIATLKDDTGLYMYN